MPNVWRRPGLRSARRPQDGEGKPLAWKKVNDDVAQNVPAVKEEIADLKKLFWPASLSRNPDVVAAALAAVDAPPWADVRGTFWPDTSEITLLEAAVLSTHAKTRRDTRRLCLDSVLVFADVRRKKRTSWGCSWRSLLMERCCHVLGPTQRRASP